MDLSLKERVLLANQFQILEMLDPNSASVYRQRRIALERGYTYDYRWIVEGFEKDPASEERCREVWDILEMHERLRDSYQQLSNGSEIDEAEIRFSGFDANNESWEFGYVSYILRHLERYSSLAVTDPKSLGPRLDVYRRMLKVWKQFKDSGDLSAEQIKQIITAGRSGSD